VLSVPQVDDKLKRIGHPLVTPSEGSIAPTRYRVVVLTVFHVLGVPQVDDKLKHVGHWLSNLVVDC